MNSSEFVGSFFFWVLIILIAIVVVYLIIALIRRGKVSRMKHVELYFDDHFSDIISEWDIVKRSQLSEWKRDMSKRLDSVGVNIDGLMKSRRSIDNRLGALEKELDKIE